MTKEKKKKIGRPSKFKEEYIDQAYNFCLLGADNQKLAKLFHVSDFSIDEWMRQIPAFSSAIKEGRDIADANVGKSLYQRACGYSHPEEKIFCNKAGEITKVTTTKHYPPDPVSMIFWLKNRHRDVWKDKRETETKITISTEELSDSELENIATGGSPRAAKQAAVKAGSDQFH
jgi:hypothetical protein